LGARPAAVAGPVAREPGLVAPLEEAVTGLAGPDVVVDAADLLLFALVLAQVRVVLDLAEAHHRRAALVALARAVAEEETETQEGRHAEHAERDPDDGPLEDARHALDPAGLVRRVRAAHRRHVAPRSQ